MANFDPSNDRCLTAFLHVKTSPEWLAFSIPERTERATKYLRSLITEFEGDVIFRWYDVEFYSAELSDIIVMDCKDHLVYQMFIEKMRETPMWDRWFTIEKILVGELNAASKNYGFPHYESH